MAIQPGLAKEITITVQAEHPAATFDKNIPPVLSTPHLIGFLEGAAHAVIAGELEEGQSSVGSQINLRHLAATPVGMQVRIRVALLEVDGRRLIYKVEAWDEVEKVAEGDHERFIIDWKRFVDKVEKKASQK
jgi:fluoroacetyl-CoA thioesterase